jgi:hypothetical protein
VVSLINKKIWVSPASIAVKDTSHNRTYDSE